MTFAMFLAKKGIIPMKKYYHDPYLQNQSNFTVAMLLVKNGIIPPKQWCHDADRQINNVPLKEQLLKYNIIPPRYLIDMTTNKEIFISDLKNKKFPVPSEFQETKPTIFDIAMLKQIPNISGHEANEQNEDGFTVAMILAFNKVKVPIEWQHGKNFKNIYKQTIFDMCLYHKIIPQQWICKDPAYQDINGNTQAMLLAQNNIKIPKYLYHNTVIQNNNGYTVAMIQAMQGRIPDKQWIHDRYLRQQYKNVQRNKFGHSNIRRYFTVQNFLYSKRIQVPEEWKYTPLNGYEDNQAMIDARNGIVSQLGNNNPKYQNMYGDTVAMLLLQKGIIPPNQWMHDIDMKNSNDQSIRSLLYNMGYIYKDNNIIPNCKLQTLNDICQICLSEGEQQFVQTNCGHKICFECFQQLIKQRNNQQCPVCKKQNYYEQNKLQNNQVKKPVSFNVTF